MKAFLIALAISLSFATSAAIATDAGTPPPAGANARYAAQLDAAADTFQTAVKKCNHQPPEMWDACRQAAVTAYRGAAGYAAETLAAQGSK